MRWLSPPDSVPEARAEREIFEADIDQKFQPLADFLEHAHGDLVLLGGEPSGVGQRTIRAAPLTDISETSPICLPAIFTHKASGLRR